MRKKKTTTATETVKTASAAAKTAVKEGTTVTKKATVKAEAASAKNTAVKEEKTAAVAKETVAETAKETVIADTTLEIFETRVSMAALNNAIMADAKANGFCGEINAYINAAERAVYYTVDNDPKKGNKIELSGIAE